MRMRPAANNVTRCRMRHSVAVEPSDGHAKVHL